MGRLHHPTEPHLVVHITACVSQRIHYDLRGDAPVLLRWLDYYRPPYGYKVYGFVIMPDHWHAVLSTGDEKTVADIVGEVRRRFSRAIGRRVWQPDFYDRVLRREVHIPAAVEYMHWNPVRAGLVEHPAQWPWSSFAAYHGTGEPVFAIDHPGPLLWTHDGPGSHTPRHGRLA